MKTKASSANLLLEVSFKRSNVKNHPAPKKISQHALRLIYFLAKRACSAYSMHNQTKRLDTGEEPRYFGKYIAALTALNLQNRKTP